MQRPGGLLLGLSRVGLGGRPPEYCALLELTGRPCPAAAETEPAGAPGAAPLPWGPAGLQYLAARAESLATSAPSDFAWRWPAVPASEPPNGYPVHLSPGPARDGSHPASGTG